jgi:hypothetical protein
MIEKTTHKLAFVLLTIFATGGGIMPAASGAVESPSVIENSATREIEAASARRRDNYKRRD